VTPFSFGDITGLPIVEILDELVRAVATTRAVVLSAPPGAGKTTVVPLALGLQTGSHGPSARLIMLEPRRLAARAAAQQLAARIGEPLGLRVGLRTGEETIVSDATVIEVMTTGVLPRMAQNDPSLDGIRTIVFDEFHERSIAGDLGLALCLDIRAALRPDLALVVMSATLDIEPIVALLTSSLGTPPGVVRSNGRSFPVEVVWGNAPVAGRWEHDMATTIQRALAAIPDGDVLAFCPGIAEIGRVRRALVVPDSVDVIDLHGSLSPTDQDQALRPAPNGRRNVVLATSIAETSVTLPGVTIVVDGGLDRHARFDPRRGLGGLVTVPVSRATAEQRRGRAGRVRPGTCYRLWSESNNRSRPNFPAPEVAEADLTPLALELAAWGAADLRWVDRPDAARLQAGRAVLHELGFVDEVGVVTPSGRDAVTLGVHPRLAAIVQAGVQTSEASLGVALAALLSERDLLVGPVAQRPSDLGERVGLLADASSADRRRRDRILTIANRLAQRVGIRFSAADAARNVDAAGRLLAAGYPDRIAMLRGHGTFTLKNGTGGVTRQTDSLAGCAWLVVAELDNVGTADARITLAAPLSPDDVAAVVEPRTTTRDEVSVRNGRVFAVRRTLFGALTVREGAIANPSTDLVQRAVIESVLRDGIGALEIDEALEGWIDRVRCCHRFLGGDWPDMSAVALETSVDKWLSPFLAGVRTSADVRGIDVACALRARIPRNLVGTLDRLSPTHLTVPSGSSVSIDYAPDTPVLAVKLQEMFGCTATPLLGDGKIPLVIHLLSPARHPLQITSDLATFWKNVYPQVRGEMRGRYPKHPWPDNPLVALPTAKTNRALRRDT
jgi:ATP-dependent helicase HrpB